MGCSYPLARLTDIAEVSTGKTNRQDAVRAGTYPLFDRSQEVKRSSKFLYDAAAIIVPGEGKEFVPRFYKGKFDLHQRAYAIIPRRDCNAEFIYYAVQNQRDHFSRVAVGSTVKSLRLSSFETMTIPLPDLRTQDAIAFTMGCIDSKIKVNQRTNDYLAA